MEQKHLRDVMLRGKSLIDVKYDVLMLIGYALLFLMLNTLALKRYRKA